MKAAAFKVVRRSTIWIPGTGPQHDRGRGHLFVVLTEPGPKGNVLAVPICSATGNYDGTCKLDSADHGYLTHLSYVAYSKMNIYSASIIESQVQRGIVEDHGLMDERAFA